MKYNTWKDRIESLLNRKLLHPLTLDDFITEIEKYGDDKMLVDNAPDLDECEDWAEFKSNLQYASGWMRVSKEVNFPHYLGTAEQFIYALKKCYTIDYYAEDTNGEYLVFEDYNSLKDWIHQGFDFKDKEEGFNQLKNFIENNSDTNIELYEVEDLYYEED